MSEGLPTLPENEEGATTPRVDATGNDETTINPRTYEPNTNLSDAQTKPNPTLGNAEETQRVPTIDEVDQNTPIRPSTTIGEKVRKLFGVKKSNDPGADVVTNVDRQEAYKVDRNNPPTSLPEMPPEKK